MHHIVCLAVGGGMSLCKHCGYKVAVAVLGPLTTNPEDPRPFHFPFLPLALRTSIASPAQGALPTLPLCLGCPTCPPPPLLALHLWGSSGPPESNVISPLSYLLLSYPSLQINYFHLHCLIVLLKYAVTQCLLSSSPVCPNSVLPWMRVCSG